LLQSFFKAAFTQSGFLFFNYIANTPQKALMLNKA
jgi:hypothetical protein